jgi:transcriptional regulator with XRE-family HTH domain
MSLNAEFVRLLARSGWSQSEAARRLSLSPAVVSRYVSGQTRPSTTVVMLFKLLIGDQAPLPSADSAKARHSLLPLDPLETELVSLLRQLNETQRRQVLAGVRSIVGAFGAKP